MKIAVLSGKGGAGKTFVAVNLATVAAYATYIDCDVEEPNGRIFLKPMDCATQPVHTFIPTFQTEKCTGCRACVDICRFHALVFIKDKPMLFPTVCHACGGCQLICPTHAIVEAPHAVGTVEIGQSGSVHVVTGELRLGEASAVPVITQALSHAPAHGLTVIDCPPGSACSVMESITDVDYCVLVVEPTAFGLHNFQMVHELVQLIKRPCGVVINKADQPYAPLQDYCTAHHVPILLEIPFSPQLAQWGADGNIATTQDADLHSQFTALLSNIVNEVTP